MIDFPHGLFKAGYDFFSRSSSQRGISQVEELVCKNPGHSHPQAKGAVCLGLGVLGWGAIRFLGQERVFLFLDGLPPSCPFKILTGLPCAFCGMTHAFLHAGFFQWREAWRCNALSLPLLGGGIALLMALSLGVKIRTTPRARRIWTGLGVGILVAYAVIRSL